MPTGLKGHQQLWSGCAAKPSERQSRPLGAATQPVTLNCRANVTRRLGGLDEALSLWDITYLCWNLTDQGVELVASRRLPQFTVEPPLTLVDAPTLESVDAGEVLAHLNSTHITLPRRATPRFETASEAVRLKAVIYSRVLGALIGGSAAPFVLTHY